MKYLTTIILLLIFSTTAFAQGEIYAKKEADEKFGSVVSKKVISVSELHETLKTVNNRLLIYFDTKYFALGSMNNKIFSDVQTEMGELKLRSFGKDKVLELLEKSNDSLITIEQREGLTKDTGENIITITYGDFTLELSSGCPPWCD